MAGEESAKVSPFCQLSWPPENRTPDCQLRRASHPLPFMTQMVTIRLRGRKGQSHVSQFSVCCSVHFATSLKAPKPALRRPHGGILRRYTAHSSFQVGQCMCVPTWKWRPHPCISHKHSDVFCPAVGRMELSSQNQRAAQSQYSGQHFLKQFPPWSPSCPSCSIRVCTLSRVGPPPLPSAIFSSPRAQTHPFGSGSVFQGPAEHDSSVCHSTLQF